MKHILKKFLTKKNNTSLPEISQSILICFKCLLIILFICLIFNSSILNAQKVTGLSGWNIFIDPGHSQTENKGLYGYSEAEKVLRVGLFLSDYLLEETDIDTVYITRENDNQYVSLSQRTDIANALGAAWYHSIHSDATAEPTTTNNSTLVMWGGWRENGQTVEKTPNGGKAMSLQIVDILTRSMRTNTHGGYADRTYYQGFPENHDNKYPYLSVNRRSTMPSELSEAGFHTNANQQPRNMNTDWKKLEARALYWSILKYHGLERPPVRIVTGYIIDDETNTPVNGATVQIENKTYITDTYSSLFYKYSTDSTQLHNGFYYLEDFSKDTVQMIVSAPDYFPDTAHVAISDTFFTFRDVHLIPSVLPTIVSYTPSVNDTITPGYVDIAFGFNRVMDTASVRAGLSITPADKILSYWVNGNKTLMIYTGELKKGKDYTITVLPTATDLYGNSLDIDGDGVGGDTLSFNFSTISNTVSVDDNDKGLPGEFGLSQNYPNPFNPSTTINYNLPYSTFVDLTIYDVLGKKVATLVNEFKHAGNHEVHFEASHLSSGIYFYQLRTDKHMEVKNMLLLK